MIRRLGEFIIEGGWRELWSWIDAPLIGCLAYLALILIAHFIGKAVQ